MCGLGARAAEGRLAGRSALETLFACFLCDQPAVLAEGCWLPPPTETGCRRAIFLEDCISKDYSQVLVKDIFGL